MSTSPTIQHGPSQASWCPAWLCGTPTPRPVPGGEGHGPPSRGRSPAAPANGVSHAAPNEPGRPLSPGAEPRPQPAAGGCRDGRPGLGDPHGRGGGGSWEGPPRRVPRPRRCRRRRVRRFPGKPGPAAGRKTHQGSGRGGRDTRHRHGPLLRAARLRRASGYVILTWQGGVQRWAWDRHSKCAQPPPNIMYQPQSWAGGTGPAGGHGARHGAWHQQWGAGPAPSPGKCCQTTRRVSQHLIAHRLVFPSGHMKLVQFSLAMP